MAIGGPPVATGGEKFSITGGPPLATTKCVMVTGGLPWVVSTGNYTTLACYRECPEKAPFQELRNAY